MIAGSLVVDHIAVTSVTIDAVHMRVQVRVGLLDSKTGVTLAEVAVNPPVKKVAGAVDALLKAVEEEAAKVLLADGGAAAASNGVASEGTMAEDLLSLFQDDNTKTPQE